MSADAMHIGEAARLSGVSAKMIRHYEAAGLIPAADRSQAGYRRYSERDIHKLRFIRAARDLGFSIHQIAELLSLWQDTHRPSSKVKQLAEQHAAALTQKILALQAMKTELEILAQACHGDERPDCPILDRLAAHEPACKRTGNRDEDSWR